MNPPYAGQDVFLAQKPSDPEPLEIRAGDTVQWTRYYSDYPAGAGYTLSYVFVGRTSLYAVASQASTAQPDGFNIVISAATSQGWVPGQYRWQAYIKDAAGERFTVGEGVATVLPNLELATNGQDDREDDEITLDNIRAMLKGKATADAQRYMINGRELQRYTWAELLKAEAVYARRVRSIRIRRGEKVPSRRIGARFGGVCGR